MYAMLNARYEEVRDVKQDDNDGNVKVRICTGNGRRAGSERRQRGITVVDAVRSAHMVVGSHCSASTLRQACSG